MNLSPVDLKIKKPNIKFVDEHGIDSAGLTKEWLELVTEEALNPDRRYFAFLLKNILQCDPLSI